MLNSEEVEKIREIVAEVLEVEKEEVKDDTDLIEELDADSMMGLEMLSNVEKEFHVKIPDEKLEAFDSVASISDVVEGELKLNVK